MTTDDPFKNVQATGSTAVATKETEAKAEPADVVDPMAAFLAEMSSMTIDEDDFGGPVEFVSTYIKPADKTWVPVRITDAKVEPRDMKAVVAYTKTGEMVTNPKLIDKLVELEGAEQVVETVTLWQFVIEAEHVSTLFGERSSPYRLYSPVFPMRIPLGKPRMRGGVQEVGFDKISGKKLLAATRVVKPGLKVEEDREKLQELCDAMVANGGATVMARIRHRRTNKTDAIPRKYAEGPLAGQFVKARIGEDGSPLRLTKQGQTFFHKSGGEEYTGDADGLIPFQDDYLIPDNSDDAAMVKDIVERENVFDNLADDVFNLPGREVVIQRNTAEGEEETGVEATVTWETIGNIAINPVKAGTPIQAVVGGDPKTGELITATWLGTHWQEVQKPYELSVSETGEPKLLPIPQDGAAVANGLDVFK